MKRKQFRVGAVTTVVVVFVTGGREEQQLILTYWVTVIEAGGDTGLGFGEGGLPTRGVYRIC